MKLADRIALRLDSEDCKYLHYLAIKHDTTMSKIVRDLLKALKNDLEFRQKIFGF